jgi:hypothetical protein
MKKKNNSNLFSQGPKARDSRTPEAEQLFIQLQRFQQSFDASAFDALVRSQGVRVVHLRAIPDPSGKADSGDTHAVQGPRQPSDGFIYKEAGCMQVFFSNDSSQFQVEIEGLIKHDTAVITPPAYYEDDPTKPVLLAPYDKLYIKDVELRIINQQFVEASSTGIDRLQYPATCVEHLIDANGVEYEEGKHFVITPEGHIKWISQTRPGWNPRLNRGVVYGIRYRYIPFFVVARILHEVRVSQVTDPNTYERKVERMPYQVLVVRENILHDVNRDVHNKIFDNRLQYAPPVGGLLGNQ